MRLLPCILYLWWLERAQWEDSAVDIRTLALVEKYFSCSYLGIYFEPVGDSDLWSLSQTAPSTCNNYCIVIFVSGMEPTFFNMHIYETSSKLKYPSPLIIHMLKITFNVKQIVLHLDARLYVY